MLWTRPDGSLLPEEETSAMRRFLPYLLRTRNESFVLFEQELDLTRTFQYLEERRGRRAQDGVREGARDPGSEASEPPEVGLFHVILCAAARAFGERPQLNRFVVGGKIYQRRHIELSFAITKQRSDSGALTTTKLRFLPTETPLSVAEKVQAAVRFGRSDKESRADKETALVTRLPGPLLRLLLWLQRGLDAWNLLPAALIEPDPLYCSMFLANLGSIGLDSAYHHLFEYGTCSFFAVIGKVQRRAHPQADGTAPVRPVLNIKYTFDERITDGWYCARSLDLFRQWVEDPAQLETPSQSPSQLTD
jgi:hypothetical protein